MALLVRKLSFLPIISSRSSGSCVGSYIASRTFATRRSATNKVPAVIVNDDDDTTTDEDLDSADSVELQVDNAIKELDTMDDADAVPCRVSVPPQRRAWATSQDEHALRFRMDMPGISKEDVKVYVDNMKLIVRGRYAQLKEHAEDEGHVLADNVGVYFAELWLPENVQKEKIKSQMKDGMLLVTAPKEVTNVLVE